MKRLKNTIAFFALLGALVCPLSSRADFFGGDIPLLIQIVSNTLQELAQLRGILSIGNDTLGLLKEVNDGIRNALELVKTPGLLLQPGALGNLKRPDELLRTLETLYGKVPRSSESKMQQMTDQSVAEAMALHNQAFDYANQIDPEAERIKKHSTGVSPLGAGRLTAQSLGVLVHVSNQILRTNAAMLKLLSENLALQNRKEKLNSEQFQLQYRDLSQAFSQFPSFKQSTTLRK